MNEVMKIDKDIAREMAVGRAGGMVFQNASEVMEYAKMMAVSGSAVPKHLRGQPGACLGIIDDAMRFEMSPYALARKSYFVNDNLAYEAQVLAAIVIARSPLKQRPDIQFDGEGAGRRARVIGEFSDGATREYLSPPIGAISPKNSPLWKTDPDQQLSYYSLRAFARRHCPDVLMGVYDYEEMAGLKDVTPKKPDLISKLTAPDQESDGFDRDFVNSEIEDLSPAASTGGMDGDDPSTADASAPHREASAENIPMLRQLRDALEAAKDGEALEAVIQKFGPQFAAMRDSGDAQLWKDANAMIRERREDLGGGGNDDLRRH